MMPPTFAAAMMMTDGFAESTASKVASRSFRSSSDERHPTRFVNPSAFRRRHTAEPTNPPCPAT